MNPLKYMVQGFSHLLFPSICVGCGGDLNHANQLVCLRCFHQLPETHFYDFPNNPIEKIFWGRVPILAASCHYYFSKQSILQNIVHQFKYEGKKQVGEQFGKLMAEALMQSPRFSEMDVLLPLPLFANRQKKRGYNQAQVLCESIAKRMKIPVLSNAMQRISATETQTHKSRIDRWRNMEGKFQLVNRASLRNKHVLLVDDIITTGATIDACASELLLVEGIRISIAALAYTVI
jgi:ComF family protein